MNFTLEKLAAITATLPKSPLFHYCVVRPEVADLLRRETTVPIQPGDPPAAIEIYIKPGQESASWLFSDGKTCRRYLAGELSELDLLAMITGGGCVPNSVRNVS